jgi:putative FmdB family regulatory protein
MPTYEYECDACKHRFEQFQSMKDKALEKCPKCGKMKLRRLIGTGGAVLFKGSGFYETDYKRAGKKPSCEKCDAKTECPAPKPEKHGSSKAE